jgi:hypothetical protein
MMAMQAIVVPTITCGSLTLTYGMSRPLGGASSVRWTLGRTAVEREVALCARCLEWPQTASGVLMSAPTY